MATMADVLKEAIMNLSTTSLRKELEFLCHKHPAVIPTLESRLLVQGKYIVRYHANSESEDDASNETEENQLETKTRDVREPIVIGDEEYAARMATCENCEREFDTTVNNRGDCVWHLGGKYVDDSSDFWADHDENCHGPYEAFEDDPDYAEGFVWECCDKPGDDSGCKVTKHKARTNVVAANSHDPATSKKRKAEGGEQIIESKRSQRK